MNLYGGNQGSRFTPGGGTFPPGGGAGSNFSNVGQPFGQMGPGFTDDLGHPMHPLPGGPPTEMTDRNLVHPFDNTLALDAGTSPSVVVWGTTREFTILTRCRD
jgi:hypothetical protein